MPVEIPSKFSNILSKFIPVFNPIRTQIRTKIFKPRGFKMRTDEVPLQVPERLAEVQKQLKGRYILIHPMQPRSHFETIFNF